MNVTVTSLQDVSTEKVRYSLIRSKQTPSSRIALPKVFVMPTLTSFTPKRHVPGKDWIHIHGIQLTDSYYNKPAAVEVVFGVDIFGILYNGGIRRCAPVEPVAFSTVFGWVLVGTINGFDSTQSTIDNHATTLQLDLSKKLTRFWQIEEVSSDKILSSDDAYCKQMFKKTHTCDGKSCYSVRLPRN